MATLEQIFRGKFLKLLVAFSLYLSLGIYFHTAASIETAPDTLQASMNSKNIEKAKVLEVYTNAENGTSLELQYLGKPTRKKLMVKISAQNGVQYISEATVNDVYDVLEVNMNDRLPAGDYELTLATSKKELANIDFTVAEEQTLARFR